MPDNYAPVDPDSRRARGRVFAYPARGHACGFRIVREPGARVVNAP